MSIAVLQPLAVLSAALRLIILLLPWQPWRNNHVLSLPAQGDRAEPDMSDVTVVMLETRLFRAIGGLASIRGALIDDCALARQVKAAGYRTWIGQSRAVRSVRPYRGLADIWGMVARSAFTQLRYSPVILVLTSAAMADLFLAPPVAGLSARNPACLAGPIAWGLMAASDSPTVRYYGLSPLWAALMPLTGALYLGMTWSSALSYWRGRRSIWKGRVYRQGADTDLHKRPALANMAVAGFTSATPAGRVRR